LGAQTEKIPLVSTPYFQNYTAGYTSRFGAQSAWPDIAAQLYGQRLVDLFPAFATSGDTVQLRICPDPQGSPSSCPASNGGILVNATDQPLIPAQYHKALIDYAVAEILDISNRPDNAKFALNKYEKAVNDALDYARFYGDGMAEQNIISVWGNDC